MQNEEHPRQQAINDFYSFWETASKESLERSVSKALKDHDRSPMIPDGTDYEALLALARSFTGLSGMKHELTQVLDAGRDKVVVRWTLSAEHTGEMFGAPATGKTVCFSGHDILAFQDGKIAELWHIEQLFQLSLQLRSPE